MQQVLDLCSGIGGFSLASKIAGGFHTIAFCDRSKFCQDLLSKRFPGIPIFEDLKDVTAKSLRDRNIYKVDGITAGLPCPPFSCAGKQLAEDDDRNLFPEYFRILREVQPRWSIVENVPGLLSAKGGKFFREVLREITLFGYNAEWRIVSAADVGAVHKRERLWIILWKPSINVADSKSWIKVKCDRYNIDSQNRTNFTSISSSTKTCDSRKNRRKQQLLQTIKGRAISFLGNGSQPTQVPKPEFCRSNDAVPAKLDGYLLKQCGLNDWIQCSTIPLIPRLTAEQIATLSPIELESYREARAEYERIRKEHKERLMALGNAIVPQSGAIAFYRLKQILNL